MRELSFSRGLLQAVEVITLMFLFASVDFGLADDSPVPASKVSSQGGYERLASRAKRVGSVRIIVKVNVAARPMGELSQSEATLQMDMIAQAQETVLEKLSGYNVSDSYKYKFIPHISMTVDRAALDALLALPDVENVEEDSVMPYNAR
ncbi:MAG: protease inhibitor I9 family protein [Nitrospirae bacterium]|nr:protease inhibitor I9 family protein [Nitrospirota bacterium]